MEHRHHIHAITLDEGSILRRTPEVEHERSIAIADLLERNHFLPAALVDGGPYALHLRAGERRLHLQISTDGEQQDCELAIPLQPFKMLIKDYFLVCESYFEAIKTASPSKIEAIDMGRRGIHNEGSELLQSLLTGKVEMDFDTARRLFTLLCVLHIK